MEQNLKVFYQFGFKEVGKSGHSQVYGNCVFCGSINKFYVSTETKKWDCKVCGLSGGYQKFLNEILDATDGSKLKELSDNRGISLQTFKKFAVGYFKPTDSYIIPHFCLDEEKLNNLRIYDRTSLIWAAGAEVSLYNLPALNSDYETIWLCEGEWDTMVMDEIIHTVCAEGEIAIGVPGALTFSSEWDSYFKGKNVNVVFDNDYPREKNGKIIKGAGVLGMQKVHKLLTGVAKTIKYIHWPEDYDDGFDIRDFFKARKLDHRRTLRGIKNLLRPIPPDFEEEQKKHESKTELKGSMVPYKKVHEVYKRWLHLVDTDVIDVLFGTVLANRMLGDPVWMFLVAKSGDAKSVFIMSMSDAHGIISTTSLTPQSLISGFGAQFGSDPSLIPKLHEKCLLVKDFTTVLSMNPQVRDEIFGILRDAYDGKTEKTFGNGIIRAYTSRFGLLAGVTPAIELFTEGHTALGERFLRWKMRGTDDTDIERILCRKAMDNTSHEDEMKKDLSDIAKAVLEHNYAHNPDVSESIKEKIISLSQWVAIMRGTINRDKYSKEITHKPFYERPTRLTKQFYKILLAITQFRGLRSATGVEFDVVKHIGLSTAPTKTEDLTRLLFKAGRDRSFTLGDMKEMVALPDVTVQRMLENLCILSILEKKKADSKSLISKYEYRLTSHIKRLSTEAEIYE